MNKNWIWVAEKWLDDSFCKQCIQKFDEDDRSTSGKTGKGFDEKKISEDLCISVFSDWKEYDFIFKNNLSENLIKYLKYIKKEYIYVNESDQLTDTGYQIQKTIGGKGFYDWHNDECFCYVNNTLMQRIYTFIWYLNDVEGPGGETEFYDGTKIKPEEGKMILFPSTFTHVHRGVMPLVEQTKYICTGWIHTPIIIQ